MSSVKLVDVREHALSLDEVYAAVRDPAAGGVVLFVGTVRDNADGKGVRGLGYSAHPTAVERMNEVASVVAQRFPAVAVAALHRVGDLAVGDIAVIVAAACPHRGEAFEAARMLIDELKATTPIWKHQLFADGTDEWVNAP